MALMLCLLQLTARSRVLLVLGQNIVPILVSRVHHAATRNPKHHTSYKFLGLGHMQDIVKTYADQIKQLKLQELNHSRKYMCSLTQLDNYNCLLMAISEKDIPCIHQIVDVALCHGSSVREVVNKLKDALEGAYTPRGYGTDDLDITTLIFRLGGRQLLFALNQSLGLPSLRTLCTKSTFTSIVPTIGPIQDEQFDQNIQNLVIHTRARSSLASLHGVSLMIDEIALKRWRFTLHPPARLGLATVAHITGMYGDVIWVPYPYRRGFRARIDGYGVQLFKYRMTPHMPSFDVQDSDQGLATTLMLPILSFGFLTGSQCFDRMQIINLLNTLLILVLDPGGTHPGPLHSLKTVVLGPGAAPFPHPLLVFPYFWTTYLHSMASSSRSNPTVDQDFQEVLGRGKRPKNVERMNALIQAEGEDNDKPLRHPRRPRRVPRKKIIPSVDNDNYFSCLPVEEASDADDADFTQGSESGSESSSSASDSDNNIQDHEISNVELAMILPMKTVPPRGGNTNPDARHLRKKTSLKSKRKTTIRNSSTANRPQLSKRARVEEVEDDDNNGVQPSSGRTSTITQFLSSPLRWPALCKTEDATDMEHILYRAIGSWNRTGASASVGPIWSLATDGDATSLFVKFPLSPESPLYGTLVNLQGLNLFTGEGICTLIRAPRGIVINNGRLPAYDEAAVTKLLHPDDPQDVPRAVELMLAIIKFSQSQCHVLDDSFSLEVNTHADLISISLLSALLESILTPFINISLSLSEQFQYLSCYAHLAYAFFHAHRHSFMSYQLYYDTQTMVKNATFSLSKQQSLDPHARFYLSDVGDDPLEILFGCTHMIGGHNSAYSYAQAIDRLGTAKDIDGVFKCHPELDPGHWHLKLTCHEGVDHINREIWKGDIVAGRCDLPLAWRNGRDSALSILITSQLDPVHYSFNDHFNNSDVDMLRPFGQNKYFGITTEEELKDPSYVPPELPPVMRSPPSQHLETILSNEDGDMLQLEESDRHEEEDEIMLTFQEALINESPADAPSQSSSELPPADTLSPPLLHGPGIRPDDYLLYGGRWIYKQTEGYTKVNRRIDMSAGHQE
ncbi:hypothetical protein BDR03DRAFT_1051571, partial [Suillus americanus]